MFRMLLYRDVPTDMMTVRIGCLYTNIQITRSSGACLRSSDKRRTETFSQQYSAFLRPELNPEA
jgi:hypothetical protein